MRADVFRRNAFGLVMLALFAGSLAAQFALAMATGDTVAQWAKDVAENWESEFLQLAAQIVGLKYLYHVGSPSSREGSERVEAKLDLLIRQHVRNGDDVLDQLDKLYMRER